LIEGIEAAFVAEENAYRGNDTARVGEARVIRERLFMDDSWLSMEVSAEGSVGPRDYHPDCVKRYAALARLIERVAGVERAHVTLGETCGCTFVSVRLQEGW
jgi:hypothetical protein